MIVNLVFYNLIDTSDYIVLYIIVRLKNFGIFVQHCIQSYKLHVILFFNYNKTLFNEPNSLVYEFIAKYSSEKKKYNAM